MNRSEQPTRIRLVQELLGAWYQRYRRDLPWRLVSRSKTGYIRDPYRVLVAELMLQQTQVSRVIPRYLSFLTQWPTIDALAHASLSEILIAWKGLGYNRRAKHLLETAKIIMHAYAGQFPIENKELRLLPGFGPYMTAALRVFAFGKQEPIIDVNIARVLSRVFCGLGMVSPKEMNAIALQVLPPGKADDWHQGLMDFGSLICTARRPECSRCPLRHLCRAYKTAQKAGETDVASWIARHPKEKKYSPKDRGKRFEETDRYFRGRIIDMLRISNTKMEVLQQEMKMAHGLEDRKRFGMLIESLVIDGLIQVRHSTVSLVK